MKDELLMFGGDGLLAVFTATQADEVMKWVSLALTIITTIVTLGFTIYKWYKKSMEDGKIDSKEIEELENIFKKGHEDEDDK